MMFGIDAIIAEHFKMLLRDVNNKPFDEFKAGTVSVIVSLSS